MSPWWRREGRQSFDDISSDNELEEVQMLVVIPVEEAGLVVMRKGGMVAFEVHLRAGMMGRFQ